MTRKDYEAIARAFARIEPLYRGEAKDVWYALRNEVATVFANDNPRFDLSRFERATVNLGGVAHE